MAKPLVFIVDDDEDVLRSLRIVLSRSYDVRTSNNATEAIEMIRSSDPSAVILDIKMPVRDGFWIFRQLRTFNTRVPIIFNSAYQDFIPPEDIQGAYAPFAYLTKTGNLPEFMHVVEAAVQSVKQAHG